MRGGGEAERTRELMRDHGRSSIGGYEDGNAIDRKDEKTDVVRERQRNFFDHVPFESLGGYPTAF